MATLREKLDNIRRKGREPVEINPEVMPSGSKLKEEKPRTEEKEDEEEE